MERNTEAADNDDEEAGLWGWYRSTSPIRKSAPLGPYSRKAGGRVPMDAPGWVSSAHLITCPPRPLVQVLSLLFTLNVQNCRN